MPESSTPTQQASTSKTTLQADRPPKPRPGDGAFLANPNPRPGDGAFLANDHRGGPSRGGGRGRGGVGRGGVAGGSAQPNGNADESGERSLSQRDGALTTTGALKGDLPKETQIVPEQNGTVSQAKLDSPNGNPHRPSQPRQLVQTKGNVNSADQANGDAPNTVPSTSPPRQPRQPRHPHRKKPSKVINGGIISDAVSDLGHPPLATLDPSATTFVPTSAFAPPSHTSPSRPTSPHHTSRSDNELPPKGFKGKGDGRKSIPVSPAPAMSSRRAAFEQQTKLTTSISRSSDSRGPRRASADEANVQQSKKRGKKEEKDDLISRLTRGLKTRPFLECPIGRITEWLCRGNLS